MAWLLTFVAVLCLYVQAFAHPGRVDSDCGHHVRATGDYHYHYDGRCGAQPAKGEKKSKKKKAAKRAKTVEPDQDDEDDTEEWEAQEHPDTNK